MPEIALTKRQPASLLVRQLGDFRLISVPVRPVRDFCFDCGHHSYCNCYNWDFFVLFRSVQGCLFCRDDGAASWIWRSTTWNGSDAFLAIATGTRIEDGRYQRYPDRACQSLV